MTTVAELIEHLKNLPQDARVEVVHAFTSRPGRHESYTSVCETDMQISKHLQYNPGNCVLIGANE